MSGSPNAFALKRDGGSPQSNVLSERDGNARAPKRRRLSADAVPSIFTYRAQADVALEVDHMILDYVVSQAIRICLASRSHERIPSQFLSNTLSMTDKFFTIFKERHPKHKPDSELRFRILLLKLTTLFTQRLTRNPTTPDRTALQDLRRVNAQRAAIWLRNANLKPSSTFDSSGLTELNMSWQELERNRAHVLHELDIPAEDEDYEDDFYGTSFCTSLLDILPLFMRVSAACNAMNGSYLTNRWMQLATEFMLQACLEQYLVFGAVGIDVLDEAFAWGYQDVRSGMDVDEVDEELKSNDIEINEMFEDETSTREANGWTTMKHETVSQFNLPSDIQSISTHLETIATKLPISTFENSMLKFLEALSSSIPEPVLTQLENGRLENMTALETQSFLTECGIDATVLSDFI